MKRERIPVFFAVDNNYIDYLKITLTSIIDNAKDENYRYNFIILHTGLSLESKKKIAKLAHKRFRVTFYNVSANLHQMENRFKTRDYYTMTTYYRLLIPDLFFYYDKALYLDCDIVVLGDLSKLYAYDLKDNLVGAIPDASVQIVPEFIQYVNEALMIKKENYFNAGVLVMNLKKMRNTHLLRRVFELSKTVAFKVAQDQDLLNVICKDMVTYIPASWNVMPIGSREVDINLIHYNLIYKPWKRNNIMYQEHFWHYASKADLEEVVKERLDEMDEEFIKREDALCLYLLALSPIIKFSPQKLQYKSSLPE